MSDFYVYFQIGLKHVLDWNGYDHILFLMVLSCASTFNEWKRVILLVSFFTIGHSLSLLLAAFGFVIVKAYLIELLIPITIFFTATYNIFTLKKSTKKSSNSLISITTIMFGIVHGLGFSNYFKNLLSGSVSEQIFPTISFAIGIEVAQILVVMAVLITAYLFQNIFKVTKRDFVLVISSIVIGVVFPMVIERI